MYLRNRLFLRVIAVALMVAMVLCGCGKDEAAAPSAPTATLSGAETAAQIAFEAPAKTEVTMRSYDTISVAVYPYIPDVALFEEILTSYWAAIEPDVKLEFVEWDCYMNGEPAGIDVLMYDALFTSYLVENNYIQSIEYSDIQNGNEKRIVPFAMEGAVENGTLYGIPFFVCSNFLIHKADDAELAEIENFADMYEVVSKRMEEDETAGLITNFQTNVPYYYLDSLIDAAGENLYFEELPDTSALSEELDEFFVQTASILAPEFEIEDETVWSPNSAAFNQGHGTVYYGYSEDMCDMDDILDNITIRTISLTEDENVPQYYVDIASIGAHVTDPQKIADCKKILNIIASKEFQLEVCLSGEEPQYILPARQSAYAELKEKYPMYDNLHKLVVDDANGVNRFGADIYTFFTNAANDLVY